MRNKKFFFEESAQMNPIAFYDKNLIESWRWKDDKW